jgi:GTP-binding protein
MVDVNSGITSMDTDISNLLRKVDKPIFLVVNKVDNSSRLNDTNEFYSLGFKNMYPVASSNGFGTGELLDDIVSLFKKKEEISDDLPRFAVVGRPNAGKSSFINALIGENRNIVTEIPGTTRDSINTKYNRFGFEFNLVDTAGIRKKSKVKENLEFYSVMRSVRAIENCDVCILLFDVSRGFDAQVKNIFWLCERNKKGIVLIANKWDLIKKNTNSTKQYETLITKEIEPFTNVKIIFVSTLNKQRIHKAIETAVDVFKGRSLKIKTRKLNDILLPIISAYPPPSIKGKYVKIKFITQLPTHYPQFAFFCNLPQYVKEPYKRFLENKIRENFDFEGVPITIFMRKK